MNFFLFRGLGDVYKRAGGGLSMMDIGIYVINGSRYRIGEQLVWVTAQETKTNPEKFKEGVDETIQLHPQLTHQTVVLNLQFIKGSKKMAMFLPMKKPQ